MNNPIISISIGFKEINQGSVLEKATFGEFFLKANGNILTSCQEIEDGKIRNGPNVAGYPIAEWFAWNWWRIFSEGERPSGEDEDDRRVRLRSWDFAHSMATIGEGYAWPNISVFSDGDQAFLQSRPSRSPGIFLCRYVGAEKTEAVPVAQLEVAIDEFIKTILTRLNDHNIRDSNLHRLWDDLKRERQDPVVARFYRLGAQMGLDPDEVGEKELREAALAMG